MTDETTPTTKTKAAAITTGATAVTVSPVAIAIMLPEPYATWFLYACALVAGLCYAATFIPMPAHPTGKLAILYRVISFLAGNVGRAANMTTALLAAVKAKNHK